MEPADQIIAAHDALARLERLLTEEVAHLRAGRLWRAVALGADKAEAFEQLREALTALRADPAPYRAQAAALTARLIPLRDLCADAATQIVTARSLSEGVLRAASRSLGPARPAAYGPALRPRRPTGAPLLVSRAS